MPNGGVNGQSVKKEKGADEQIFWSCDDQTLMRLSGVVAKKVVSEASSASSRITSKGQRSRDAAGITGINGKHWAGSG